MKSHHRPLAAALLCATLALFLTAEAQAVEVPTEGFYVSLNGGVQWQESQQLYLDGFHFVTADFSDSLDEAYQLGIAGGWLVLPSLRAELALDYRRSTIYRFSDRALDPEPTIEASGRENATTYFANLWYDLPVGGLRPYFGGGLGWADVKVRNMTAGGVPFGSVSDDTFAYQLGAGLRWVATPKLTLSFDYRYLHSSELNFGPIAALPVQGDVKAHYTSQSLLLGAQFHF